MIGSLPELRKKYLGKKKLPSKIFTDKKIFDGRDEISSTSVRNTMTKAGLWDIVYHLHLNQDGA